jgi:hypothetical protein
MQRPSLPRIAEVDDYQFECGTIRKGWNQTRKKHLNWYDTHRILSPRGYAQARGGGDRGFFEVPKSIVRNNLAI